MVLFLCLRRGFCGASAATSKGSQSKGHITTFKRLSIPVLAILLVVTLSAGEVVLVRSIDDNGSDILILLPQPTPPPALKVYVSGAVSQPRVYTLAPGGRVEDAISLAGESVAGAQLSCINMALRVTDEAQYHIPSTGEECIAAAVGPGPAGEELTDLNAASPKSWKFCAALGR